MAQYRNRGTNVWQIVIYIGKDDKGKKIFSYKTFYGTKTQAKQYGNALESKIKYSVGAKGKDLNIGELFDLWLKDVRKTISESSYVSYTGRVKRLKPYVGDLQLFDLSTMEIKKRLNQFEEELCHLAPRTIKEHYTTLRTALNYAIIMELLNNDVMKGINAPKVEHIERNVLNEEQIRIFLECAKDYKHYLVIRILALTGMRAGEVLGLKWADINFETGQLAIVRAADTKKRKLKVTHTRFVGHR